MIATVQLPKVVRGISLAGVSVPLVSVPDSTDRKRDARATMNQGQEESYERGRRDGEKALSGQLVQQRADLNDLQNGVLQSLRQIVPGVRRACESGLINLACEVAQKLVAGLPVSAEMVEAAVREALAQTEETTEFHVVLHPDDLALLQRLNSPLLASSEGATQQIHFQSAPEVSRGGCLVRTRFGVIDARRETKAELLKQALQS